MHHCVPFYPVVIFLIYIYITLRYLLIKYEDLIADTKGTFLKILNFIYILGNAKHVVDQDKLNNVIKTTSFEALQKLETTTFFDEAKKIYNKYITFFKYGPKNNWKKNLPHELAKDIEKEFKIEMEELGYL